MNLLLDTHAFIWTVNDDPKLASKARSLIIEAQNMVFVSAATAWEISIKKALGKLEAPGDYPYELQVHRLTALSITTEHALAVEQLPPHHRDPFDRLLVAQAQLEKLAIVTRDPNIQKYDVPIIAT